MILFFYFKLKDSGFNRKRDIFLHKTYYLYSKASRLKFHFTPFLLMKTLGYLCFILLLFVNLSQAQNSLSPEDQSKIKQLIADETKAFYAKDYETWMILYRQTPQTYFAQYDKGQLIVKDGWDALSSWAITWFNDGKKGATPTFSREKTNFRKVNPTYVWVTFKQVKTLDGKKETSQELRIVELIKGEWKMVNHTSMPASTSSVKEETTVSEKDKKSSVRSEKKQ